MLLITILFGVLFIIPLLFIIYIKNTQRHWAKKKVPYIEPTSIWGNIENPFKPRKGVKGCVTEAYKEFKRRGVPHGGLYLFTQPSYLPVSPELIKNILAKDFQYFNGHGFPTNEKKDPLGVHLFNLDGDPWRKMRVKLSPTFTSGKMKAMFGTLLNCGNPLIDHINQLCEEKRSFDVRDVLARFTTDVIGSCAFGLECNSFENPDSDFRKYGREAFGTSTRNKAYNFIKFVAPSAAKWVYVRKITSELEIFFKKMVKGVLDYRKTNKIERHDFIQLFLEMEKKAIANGQETLSFEQIAAQSHLFFVAGFETTSTTMTFCLHELAFHQDIQDKLREEVRETMKKYDGKLTYDGIMEMKYMDQVINETLRKHPPLAFINRICTRTYKVPDTDVTIEAGTPVVISVLGIHRDEEYYPNPEKFDPERFTEENKRKRPAFTFLPFGEGPRICLGLRFGLMQAKTGISLLLNKYRILPVEGEKYNFDYEPSSTVLSKNGRIILNVEKVAN